MDISNWRGWVRFTFSSLLIRRIAGAGKSTLQKLWFDSGEILTANRFFTRRYALNKNVKDFAIEEVLVRSPSSRYLDGTRLDGEDFYYQKSFYIGISVRHERLWEAWYWGFFCDVDSQLGLHSRGGFEWVLWLLSGGCGGFQPQSAQGIAPISILQGSDSDVLQQIRCVVLAPLGESERYLFDNAKQYVVAVERILSLFSLPNRNYSEHSFGCQQS